MDYKIEKDCVEIYSCFRDVVDLFNLVVGGGSHNLEDIFDDSFELNFNSTERLFLDGNRLIYIPNVSADSRQFWFETVLLPKFYEVEKLMNRKKEFDEYARRIINPNLPYGYRLKSCKLERDDILVTGGIESVLTFDRIGSFDVTSPVPFGAVIKKYCDIYLEGHPEIEEIKYGFEIISSKW